MALSAPCRCTSCCAEQSCAAIVRRVIADYQSEALDLTDPATFRDLGKPIGALDAKRLSFFKVLLESLGGSLTLKPSTFCGTSQLPDVPLYMVHLSSIYVGCL